MVKAPSYTQTPNEFIDHWIGILNGNEFKVLIFLARKIFGWHKTRERISISQIQLALKTNRNCVVNAIRSLEKHNLITKTVEGPNGSEATYYEIIVDEDDSNNSYQYQNGTRPSTKMVPPPSTKTVPTKETVPSVPKETLKNGTVRQCGSVDKSRTAAAEKNYRPVSQATSTVSEQNAFDPMTYRLRNGQPLDPYTINSFAKYKGEDRKKLERNIHWYEAQIDAGVIPKQSHEKYLQWAINNDMASKENYQLQNSLYARMLEAEKKIPGMRVLKTLVQIPASQRFEAASIPLNLPPATFTDNLKKYMRI